MSVLKVKNGNQWDIVPAIKGDTGDPAADESITDDMLVTDGIKTEIEWLWGNQLTDSREGEILHAEDAYTAPAVDISVDGKSTQVTTTGKNLLDPSKLMEIKNVNYLGNGVYEFPTPLSQFNDKLIWTNPGLTGNYVISFDKMNANIDQSSGGGIRLYYRMANGSNYYLTNTNAYSTWYTSSVVLDMTNVKYLSMTYNSSQYTWIRNLRIEAGNTKTDYEPYTGTKSSPSPDFQQEVNSIDELSMIIDNAAKSVLSELSWQQGSVGINSRPGLRVGSATQIRSELDENSKVAIGTTYHLHVSEGFELFIAGYTELSRDSLYNNDIVEWTPGDVAWTPTGSSYICVLIRHTDGSAIDPDESTGFIASLDPIVTPIPSLLPDGYSLRSLPDGTKDELHLSYLRPSKRAGWAWYSRELVKRITQKILDGSENWNMGSSTYDGNLGTDRFVNLTDSLNLGIRAPNSVLSPVLKSKNDYIWANPDVHLWSICRNGIQVHIVFDNETVGISSSEEEGRTDKIKMWLSDNPITIQYPLATPTTETLDPIELPIMPSQTVNVWSDPATNLKMTYIQDSNLIIENLEATIADIATS